MNTTQVDFYLDPSCPWTWLTSRWLADVAEQRDVRVRWLPFSLALLNEGRPVPPAFDTPEFRDRMATADCAMRLLTVLSDGGDDVTAGRFYTEFGRRFHDEEPHGDADPVTAAAEAAGVPFSVRESTASDTVTASIAAALDEALALAGPDVGSPVLRIDGGPRGFHGPIVSSRVTGDAAARLFDALTTLQAEQRFHEVKRGRTSGPAIGGAR